MKEKEKAELDEFYNLVGTGKEERTKRLMDLLDFHSIGSATLEDLEELRRLEICMENRGNRFDDDEIINFYDQFEALKEKRNIVSAWEMDDWENENYDCI